MKLEGLRRKSVALEGPDGAGKTTHIRRLIDELQDYGLRAQAIASPATDSLSGPILRKCIRAIDPNKANELFAYDILRSERYIIKQSTDLALLDRHIDTVRVSNTDPSVADAQIAGIVAKITPPDRVVYLDIPPEVSWAREGGNPDHPIDRDWIQTKYNRYQEIIAQNPERITVLDATQPLEVVYQGLLGIILHELRDTIADRANLYDLFLNTPGLIRFVLDAPVEVKLGVLLPMFVNIKDTMAQPSVRAEITKEMLKLANDQEYDSVLGLESGGSYYATTIANELDLPVALLRTKHKEYSGSKGDIVGKLPEPGTNVLVIDDVYATGQSASKASKRLQELKCKHSLITAFSYSSDSEIKDRLGGVNGTSVTYFRGLRTAAMRNGLLSQAEAKRLTQLVDIYRKTIYI